MDMSQNDIDKIEKKSNSAFSAYQRMKNAEKNYVIDMLRENILLQIQNSDYSEQKKNQIFKREFAINKQFIQCFYDMVIQVEKHGIEKLNRIIDILRNNSRIQQENVEILNQICNLDKIRQGHIERSQSISIQTQTMKESIDQSIQCDIQTEIEDIQRQINASQEIVSRNNEIMSRSISENSDIIETENKRLIKATSDLKQLGDERVVFKIKDIEEYVIEDKKLLQMYTNISQRNDNKYKEFVEREIVQQKIIEQMNKDNYKQISRAIQKSVHDYCRNQIKNNKNLEEAKKDIVCWGVNQKAIYKHINPLIRKHMSELYGIPDYQASQLYSIGLPYELSQRLNRDNVEMVENKKTHLVNVSIQRIKNLALYFMQKEKEQIQSKAKKHASPQAQNMRYMIQKMQLLTGLRRSDIESIQILSVEENKVTVKGISKKQKTKDNDYVVHIYRDETINYSGQQFEQDLKKFKTFFEQQGIEKRDDILDFMDNMFNPRARSNGIPTFYAEHKILGFDIEEEEQQQSKIEKNLKYRKTEHYRPHSTPRSLYVLLMSTKVEFQNYSIDKLTQVILREEQRNDVEPSDHYITFKLVSEEEIQRQQQQKKEKRSKTKLIESKEERKEESKEESKEQCKPVEENNQSVEIDFDKYCEDSNLDLCNSYVEDQDISSMREIQEILGDQKQRILDRQFQINMQILKQNSLLEICYKKQCQINQYRGKSEEIIEENKKQTEIIDREIEKIQETIENLRKDLRSLSQ